MKFRFISLSLAFSGLQGLNQQPGFEPATTTLHHLTGQSRHALLVSPPSLLDINQVRNLFRTLLQPLLPHRIIKPPPPPHDKESPKHTIKLLGCWFSQAYKKIKNIPSLSPPSFLTGSPVTRMLSS